MQKSYLEPIQTIFPVLNISATLHAVTYDDWDNLLHRYYEHNNITINPSNNFYVVLSNGVAVELIETASPGKDRKHIYFSYKNTPMFYICYKGIILQSNLINSSKLCSLIKYFLPIEIELRLSQYGNWLEYRRWDVENCCWKNWASTNISL